MPRSHLNILPAYERTRSGRRTCRPTLPLKVKPCSSRLLRPTRDATMNTQPMTVRIRDAMFENVDHRLPGENLRWHMATAHAEEPAKILLQEEEDETTTGTTTPASGRSSRSKNSSPGISVRQSSEEVFMKKDLAAEQALGLPGQMVMLRNISPAYTEQMVLEELADGGFQQPRDIDFFYMPVDCNFSGMNRGCCFINFVDNAIRNEFFSAFEGRSLRLSGPTAPQLKVQSISQKELELFLGGFDAPGAAGKQQEQLESNTFACHVKAKAPRKAQFCPFCGNHVGSSFNFCSQCGSSLADLR